MNGEMKEGLPAFTQDDVEAAIVLALFGVYKLTGLKINDATMISAFGNTLEVYLVSQAGKTDSEHHRYAELKGIAARLKKMHTLSREARAALERGDDQEANRKRAEFLAIYNGIPEAVA